MSSHVVMAVAAASLGLGVAQSAAADMPIKAPIYKAPAAVVSSGGYYVWLDGMYDNVRLPTYALGLHNSNLVTGADAGIRQTFDTHLTGGGVRGALGYWVPGTGIRLELGGSYVAARGNTSQTTGDPQSAVAAQLMNGGFGVPTGFNCIVGTFACSTQGTLSTSYDTWQINGKAAFDWQYGSVTVTPSAAVFGGNTHVDQSLSQTFRQTDATPGGIFGGGLINSGTYSANTALHWTDVGIRLGLDLNAPVTSALTVGVGGWIGGVGRNVSLSGTDSAASTGLIFNGTSALSTSASRGAFLANVEAGLAYKLTSAMTLRGFVGLNYDGSVPGIKNPTYTGSLFAPAPTSTSPASIYYASETSYYAGGGLAVRFGG